MRFAFLVALTLFLLPDQSVLADEDIIYAVQPKSTTLASRFEVVLSAVHNLNNRYVGENGLALSGLYHLQENLAVELQGNYFFQRYNSGLYEKVTSLKMGSVSNAFALVKYYRAPWLFNVDWQWSVLYGKLSFGDHVLGDVGFYILAGVGVLGLELTDPTAMINPQAIIKGPDILPFQVTTPFGAGLRIHFWQHFGLRAEIRDNVQILWARQAVPGSSTFYDISHKLWLTIGVSYVF